MSRATDESIRRRISLSQIAGNPIYFFDTSFLLENVTELAGWNHIRLEAAIAPRVENLLSRADVRLACDNGFYVIFAARDPRFARDKAIAISTDILRHFYGHRQYLAEDVDKLCRPSSAQKLAADLGISAPEGPPEGRTETPRIHAGPKTETDTHARTAGAQGPRYLALWDSKRECITSYLCTVPLVSVGFPQPAAIGLHGATEHCRADIDTLSAVIKGIRHAESRGTPAVVSTPVHAETLSWSKTRHEYCEALGRIEPKFLALIAPRVVGLDKGANLSPIAEWMRSLRRYVRWGFVHLRDVHFDFSRLGQLGASGFGTTIGAKIHAAEAPLEKLAAKAAKLTRIAADQGAIACIDNATSLDEVFLLRSQGVRIIGGPVIEQASDVPGVVRPYSFADVSPRLRAKVG